jgi:CDP-paratose 2-epimerase
MKSLRDRFGICQWFHFEDRRTLQHSVRLLHELGIRHLRTGISWADYHRPGGRVWYEEMLETLADFELLLSVWHTPPSLAVDGRCNSPPKRLLDYADFIDLVIQRHGASFSHLELWNEPNNHYKWNFSAHDPQWRLFAEMAGCAAYWARQCGVPTVLGGMVPVDPQWLRLIETHGALAHMDIVAVHGFPGMWWSDHPNWDWHSDWSGWGNKLEKVRDGGWSGPVWITETGFSTWDPLSGSAVLGHEQAMRLLDAIEARAARTYWYSLIDLDPARAAIEGFHVDENEYHLGLVDHHGRRKPAFHLLKRCLEESAGRSPTRREFTGSPRNRCGTWP